MIFGQDLKLLAIEEGICQNRFACAWCDNSCRLNLRLSLNLLSLIAVFAKIEAY